ncbi:hypothetical protein TrST_g12256 [Triparma strigata]|uniref:Uncharacterized protein n=1 Tax=Triparma strigata TaxID=1606541 RepID=A0A9W7BHP8_9STRA|nr:hypothetical protein TrST_g12256 [Triparma strigata]
MPFIRGYRTFEECLEVLEKETFRYVTVQRKFYEKKIKGKWKGFKVEMDGLDRKEFGRFVEGLRDGKTIKVDGVEEIVQEDPVEVYDKNVRECERCGVKLYGGKEWEVHLKGKMHKIRGSRKYMEKVRNKEAWMKKKESESEDVKPKATTSATTSPPPPPSPSPPAVKNSANKNKYTKDADETYVTSLQSFGKPVEVRIRQTSAEETWPGGALWDPGVVVSKLFSDVNLTPVPQSRLRGMNFLELGAGCGMTGIVVGALGGRWVCCSDMVEVVEGVTKVNVEINRELYSGKGGSNSRVVAMAVPWGEENFGLVDAVFSKMVEDTKTSKLDVIVAVDIAYQRPGMPPHFEWFLETMKYIYEVKCQAQGGNGEGGGRKKKKGKGKEAEEKELPMFIYGHRRRMGSSEDLLNLVYEYFEDVREPIPADEIDGRVFKKEEKHGIMVHVLRWRKGNIMPPT